MCKDTNRKDSRSGGSAAGSWESGFGLLESMAGLLVFMLLAMVGTKAYKGAVSNQKESEQVKALTDAVATTSEKLAGLSESALIGAGSLHLLWSSPAQVGKGPMHFRYRTVPRPTVGGAVDTTLVGLEVESGVLKDGAFVPARSFATLIAPNAARNASGQASTQAERDEEAAFYARNQDRIAALSARVVGENQIKLNSFSCYNKGECCDFMREYFANPALRANDGLKAKCLYRCALGGNVPMKDWKQACGIDFCTVAPWKTKEQCCTAILSGECKPGSACARVCLDCVGEDGASCALDVCTDPVFNDIFDCVKGTLCNGEALPEAVVPGWGDIRFICGVEECQAVDTQCENLASSCCAHYWEPLARGARPDPKMEVCARISSVDACCGPENRDGLWDFACNQDGRTTAARFEGQWYCRDGIFMGNIDDQCAVYRSCRTTTRYGKEGGGGCINWSNRKLMNVWDNPNPPVNPPTLPFGNGGFQPPSGGSNTGKSTGSGLGSFNRTPSTRSGSSFGSSGGRE